MNKSSFGAFSVLIISGLLLSGCGGGGSSGSKSPASVAPSSTGGNQSLSVSSVLSSSSASTSSTSTITHLTINGAAVADALADGKLVVTVGTVSYETNIDESLKYTISLNIPQQDIDKPFVAVATGSGADAWVQFAASFPSIKSLVEKAGSDGVLNSEEFFGVNITALTTAQYAEINNQLIKVESDEIRKAAFLSMHPIRALEKAALISRMLSDIDFSLPEKTKTTLQFLSDENLSESYVEAFRVHNFDWVHSQIAIFQSNPFESVVAPQKLAGRYFLEALNYTYMLDFNEDGTGKLQSGSMSTIYYTENPKVNTEFTWVKKGKKIRINFLKPITYSVDYYHNNSSQFISCNEYYSNNNKCSLRFDSLDLDVITETEFSKLAYIRPNVTVTNNNERIHEGELNSQLARLISVNDFPLFVTSALIGHEWFTSDYRYVFSDNTTVLKTDLVTKTVENLSWESKDNHLVVGSEDIWMTHKSVAGYDIISVTNSQVVRKSLFKREQVNMAENDWVGRWTSYPFDMFSNAQDVNANKTWRDGFEAEGAGNWVINDHHTQTAISNGVWRMERDVLAIHGDKYFMSICQGVVAENFVPQNCYLSVATRSQSFDSNVFWGSWSYPAFNEKNSGKDWVPIGSMIFTTDSTLQKIVRPFARVAANKLFNRNDGTILEMISANKEEIELCEYKLYESCTEEDKIVYQRGIELKLVTNGNGTISMKHTGYGMGGFLETSELTFVNTLMVPKGYPQILFLRTQAGAMLNASGTVSGCGGILVGFEYRIPALNEACEITVNFQ